MLQTISIIVSGKVQGVFYRQSTKEKARELEVKGFVKNLPDGNVHIIATGTIPQLDALIKWCWQGPERAGVKDVRYEACAFQSFVSFSIEK